MRYTINNQEQLHLLGRTILNDLLVQNQNDITNIFQYIERYVITSGYTLANESVAQDLLLKEIKTWLEPRLEKLIINLNQYDDQITIVNALLEYIFDQMIIIPKLLKYDDIKLCNYRNQTDQTWFINYRQSKKIYDASLSLDLAIEHIITRLSAINKLINETEVKKKAEHLPLPSLYNINELLKKLNRMIKTYECDTTPYNEHQMVIYKLIKIVENVESRYDDLKKYMIENNIENILKISDFATTKTIVPEYYRSVLGEKLPITTRQLDSIFDPGLLYTKLADIYDYENYVKTTSFLNNKKQIIMLRSTNVEYLRTDELFLAKSDLRNLLKNCIEVKCNINKSELSSDLVVIMTECNIELKEHENRLYEDFDQTSRILDKYLLYFNQLKESLQKKELILSEEHQIRNDLQSESDSDLRKITFQFKTEKTKIEEQQQKDHLIQKLINNPSILYKGIINNEQTINFDFINVHGKQCCLQLSECQCEKKFQRNPGLKIEDYRSIMESNIVKSILDNVTDKSEQINLACIGSDWFGLTIILAKLYKIGYTNFNVVNIEKPTNIPELIDKYNKLRVCFENFCNWLFKNNQNNLQSQIKVFIDTREIFSYHEATTQNKKIFIFAEDLGFTTKEVQYSNIVTKIANEIGKRDSELAVFFTKFNAEVDKLGGIPHSYAAITNTI